MIKSIQNGDHFSLILPNCVAVIKFFPKLLKEESGEKSKKTL